MAPHRAYARRAYFVGLLLAAVAAMAVSPAAAQLDLGRDGRLRAPAAGARAAKPKLAISAVVTPGAEASSATLEITAEVASGWHTYSITQKSPPGPKRTIIKLSATKDFEVAGQFVADPAPEKHTYPEIWPDVSVEEHAGKVTWSAPLKLAAGVELKDLKVAGVVNAMLCADSCDPPKDFPFVAVVQEKKRQGAAVESRTDRGVAAAVETATPPAVADSIAQPVAAKTPAAAKEPAAMGTYKAEVTHAPTIRGHLEPAAATPGSTARIVLSAEPSPGWYVYALGGDGSKLGSKPTLLVMTETSQLRKKAPVANSTPLPLKAGHDEFAVAHYAGPVQWTVELAIPETAKPGEEYQLTGMLGYQSCQEGTVCDFPRGLEFAVSLPIVEAGAAQPNTKAPLALTPIKYGQVAAAAKSSSPETGVATAAAATSGFDASQVSLDETEDAQTAFGAILAGLLGGLILNLMPCVLPVVGLKILSFVEQANHDRRRILMLNIWYSLGLLSVFLGLAIFALVLRLAVTGSSQQFIWGQQFGSIIFNVSMTAIVFVMGLSLLGVWEIPIPGFLGHGKANELVAKEGASGAFAKGAITTLLATPCSGPFLGVALGYALNKATPPAVTFATFAAVGIGMASPYLLIGAYPRLIRFLPKPGMWMETFKQLMGFVLLGTVVYMLTIISPEFVVPTVALLMGLWAACWWIGKTPYTASSAKKYKAWASSLTFAALIGVFAFTSLTDIMRHRFEKTVSDRIAASANGAAAKLEPMTDAVLPWRPFTEESLRSLTAEGRTVVVDFTADWCVNCKVLEKYVLNTPEVKDLVEQNGIVPLVADFTHTPPEIQEMMNTLKSSAVPLLAIFPAGNANRPIVFRDGYSKQTLLDALKKAGPSRMAALSSTQR